MRCEETQPLLEAYYDGELASHERDAVAAHVEKCTACAAEFAALEREHQIYAGYDRAFEPDADAAWAAVAERIGGAAAPRAVVDLRPGWLARIGEWLTLPRLAPIGVAAAVVLAVAVVLSPRAPKPVDIAGEAPRHEAPPQTPDAPLVDEPVEPILEGGDVGEVVDAPLPIQPPKRRVLAVPKPKNAPKPALPEPVITAERQYLEAIAVLSRDIERGNSSLDVSLKQDIQQPLEEIDRNIAAARRAVEQSPNDPTAVLGMLAAYDAKVDTLQQLARFQVARDR